MRYYAQVLRDEIPGVPKAIKNMARREAEDFLVRQHKPGFPFYFDVAQAEKTMKFYRQFPFPDAEWAGRPWVFEPWQEAFLTSLGVWRLKAKPRERRYNRALLLVGRKTGKTAMAALAATGRLLTAPKGQAEIYSIARQLDQAALSLNMAEKMLLHMGTSHPLLKHVSVYPGKRIVHEVIGRDGKVEEIRKWRALTKDHKSIEGVGASMCVLDEAAYVTNNDLISSIWQSMRGRESPLMLCVTTAQAEYNTRFLAWKGLLEEGFENPADADQRLFGFLYSADRLPRETDDELFERLRTSPHLWKGMLPNLDVSHTKSMVEQDFREGKSSPLARTEMLLKTFNVFTNSAVDKFIELSVVDALPSGPVREGRCILGLDVGEKSDFTSAVFLWDNGDERYSAVVKSFCPQVAFNRASEEIKLIYRAAIDTGELQICGDAVLDFQEFIPALIEMCQENKVQLAGIDPAKALEVIEALEGINIECVKIYQGFKLSGPIGRLERLLHQGHLRLDKGVLLRWMFANCRRKQRGALVMIDKPAKHLKIDGVMALIDAIHAAAQGKSKVGYFTEVALSSVGASFREAQGEISAEELEAMEAARQAQEEQEENMDPFERAYREMTGW